MSELVYPFPSPPSDTRGSVRRPNLVLPSELAPGTALLWEGTFVGGPEGWIGLFGMLEIYRVFEPADAAVGARFRAIGPDGVANLRAQGLGGVVRDLVRGAEEDQILLTICNEVEASEEEDRHFIFQVRWPIGA